MPRRRQAVVFTMCWLPWRPRNVVFGIIVWPHRECKRSSSTTGWLPCRHKTIVSTKYQPSTALPGNSCLGYGPMKPGPDWPQQDLPGKISEVNIRLAPGWSCTTTQEPHMSRPPPPPGTLIVPPPPPYHHLCIHTQTRFRFNCHLRISDGGGEQCF